MDKDKHKPPVPPKPNVQQHSESNKLPSIDNQKYNLPNKPLLKCRNGKNKHLGNKVDTSDAACCFPLSSAFKNKNGVASCRKPPPKPPKPSEAALKKARKNALEHRKKNGVTLEDKLEIDMDDIIYVDENGTESSTDYKEEDESSLFRMDLKPISNTLDEVITAVESFNTKCENTIVTFSNQNLSTDSLSSYHTAELASSSPDSLRESTVLLTGDWDGASNIDSENIVLTPLPFNSSQTHIPSIENVSYLQPHPQSLTEKMAFYYDKLVTETAEISRQEVFLVNDYTEEDQPIKPPRTRQSPIFLMPLSELPSDLFPLSKTPEPEENGHFNSSGMLVEEKSCQTLLTSVIKNPYLDKAPLIYQTLIIKPKSPPPRPPPPNFSKFDNAITMSKLPPKAPPRNRKRSKTVEVVFPPVPKARRRSLSLTELDQPKSPVSNLLSDLKSLYTRITKDKPKKTNDKIQIRPLPAPPPPPRCRSRSSSAKNIREHLISPEVRAQKVKPPKTDTKQSKDKTHLPLEPSLTNKENKRSTEDLAMDSISNSILELEKLIEQDILQDIEPVVHQKVFTQDSQCAVSPVSINQDNENTAINLPDENNDYHILIEQKQGNETAVEPNIKAVVEPDIEAVVEPDIETVAEQDSEAIGKQVIEAIVKHVIEAALEPRENSPIDLTVNQQESLAIEKQEPLFDKEADLEKPDVDNVKKDLEPCQPIESTTDSKSLGGSIDSQDEPIFVSKTNFELKIKKQGRVLLKRDSQKRPLSFEDDEDVKPKDTKDENVKLNETDSSGVIKQGCEELIEKTSDTKEVEEPIVLKDKASDTKKIEEPNILKGDTKEVEEHTILKDETSCEKKIEEEKILHDTTDCNLTTSADTSEKCNKEDIQNENNLELQENISSETSAIPAVDEALDENANPPREPSKSKSPSPEVKAHRVPSIKRLSQSIFYEEDIEPGFTVISHSKSPSPSQSRKSWDSESDVSFGDVDSISSSHRSKKGKSKSSSFSKKEKRNSNFYYELEDPKTDEKPDESKITPPTGSTEDVYKSDTPSFTASSYSEISWSSEEGEDDSSKENSKIQKKIFYIAREIMTSEEKFVDVLRLLNVDFRSEIEKKQIEVGASIIPEEILNAILNNLPQLQALNENLLINLRERILNWKEIRKISDIIIKIGPFLKLYSSYIKDFATITYTFDEACKKYPMFAATVRDYEQSSRCQKLFLKHYMLKPIQRIPQYRLLLQQYFNNLIKDSPDYEDTITALEIVSNVADHANETMKQGDNFQKMLSIQNSISDRFEIVKPGREFLKEGELWKLSRKEKQSRWFILFNDIILCLTAGQGGFFKINRVLNLTGMKLQVHHQHENEFSIISRSRSFALLARNKEDQQSWVNTLTQAIEDNTLKRSTFMEAQPQMEDGGLGKQAPVWVPDARVTMCQLCTAEFSVAFRRHHCRACGKVVCSLCSANKTVLYYLQNKMARVCNECFVKMNQEPYETGAHVSASKYAKRPSVLREVCANDQGSTISSYLFKSDNKKGNWKRFWFVLKGKVLYTYKESEDVAALQSLPVLGFEVSAFSESFLGIDPDLLFQISQGAVSYTFHGLSNDIVNRWIEALRKAAILE